MYEKVNPAHPDKVADRIAGAIVDLAYARQRDPRVAAEVLLGHGHCLVLVETSAPITRYDIRAIVLRIEPRVSCVEALVAPQDPILAGNQSGAIRCPVDGRLTPADVIAMDWLVDNVVGGFPAIDDLRDITRALVELQGIKEIELPSPSTFSWKAEEG